jgi:RNA recognition motif-containing protein
LSIPTNGSITSAYLGDPHGEKEGNTTDAYKTLFIARLSYDTTEKKLQREFEQYGPLKTVRLVQDKEGKPRGYAFLEFEKEGDMRAAYKQGDGKKIDGRRVLVDVERGRTVRNWQPRRLGKIVWSMLNIKNSSVFTFTTTTILNCRWWHGWNTQGWQ